MNLVASNDRVLRQPSRPYDFSEQGSEIAAKRLFDLLKDQMITGKGIGLSAIQLGIPLRVFVIGDPSSPSSIFPVFNPIIVDKSDDMEYYEEGCLSFPGLFVKIKRPKWIRARFASLSGEIDTYRFEGLTARIFQHEYDHLDGVIYTEKANPFHLDRARNQLKKLNRLRKKNANR